MEKNLRGYVRSVRDFPKKGVMFRDITTLLKNGEALRKAAGDLFDVYRDKGIQKVAGIESRGFVLGAILAYLLGAGFVLIRKPGKLPAATAREEYSLEYGTDAVEMHIDAVGAGECVLVHDDLLATGGTALAACRLVERQGGVVVGVSFLVELDFLRGREKLTKYDVRSLMHYASEEEL